MTDVDENLKNYAEALIGNAVRAAVGIADDWGLPRYRALDVIEDMLCKLREEEVDNVR